MTTDSRIDHIAWASRLNARWIVHNKLNATAAAYMDYVAKTDRERLARSCRLAHRLVHTVGDKEDPKPWFYGGLFSLATPVEAKRFLAPHSLLASVVPALQTKNALPASLESVNTATRQKIVRLRDTLRRMARRKHFRSQGGATGH
jgi:hypothetical protein